jgi:hypothetical protein
VQHCQQCGSARVFRSRCRNAIERLRFRITGQHPFRCHQCQWRGWRSERWDPSDEIDLCSTMRRAETPPLPAEELDRLDPHGA